jgi:hypothetical protein
MDKVIASVVDKTKQEQQARLKEQSDRQKLLKEYEAAQAKVVEIAKPRLEVLAKKAGDRASVKPTVALTRRSAAFEFRSPKALIHLTYSVAPDAAVKRVIVEQDLRIVPVLWKFDSHAEFSSPIAPLDEAGLKKWLDDRIIRFVELYVQIHESEILDKAEYVEDPVAKVKFPKFAAGATLEHGGQTHYFIDDKSRQEFANQKGVKA